MSDWIEEAMCHSILRSNSLIFIIDKHLFQQFNSFIINPMFISIGDQFVEVHLVLVFDHAGYLVW